MERIIVKGFYITSNGDQTVGEFDAYYRLVGDNGDFEFETPEDLEEFKDLIADAFELCHDPKPYVETFEEYNKRIEDENKLFDAIYESETNKVSK